MKTGVWAIIALVIIGIGLTLALPREETGYISGEAGSCKVQMDVAPNSLNTYFKTFVCGETLTTKDCYTLVYENGICTTSYHYHEIK
jgi:hypothetical protein